MGLKCFSSFWNNLNSFCKPHQASVVGENSCGYISFGHNDVRFFPSNQQHRECSIRTPQFEDMALIRDWAATCV